MQSQGPPNAPKAQCPEDGAIALFCQGKLDSALRSRLETHFDRCIDCQTLVASLAVANVIAEPTSEPSRDTTVRADAPTRELEVGHTVGPYTLVRHLGTGGMGQVFAAIDERLDRKVALKFITTAEPGATERFYTEAKILAGLNHPNLVVLHELGNTDGHDYVAMEYVAGQTLAEWLVQKPRSWRNIVEVFLQAGRGIAFAHDHRVVHRDIKPQNILVGFDGRVRVADFGLATLQTNPGRPEQQAHQPGPALDVNESGIVGTPAYLAPEVRAGLPADERSDQYSFFATLYEALCGHRPNGDATKQQITRRDSPAPLRAALKTGLAQSPDNRYPTMATAVAALAKTLNRRRKPVIAVTIGVLAAASVATPLIINNLDDPAERCANGAIRFNDTWNRERYNELRSSAPVHTQAALVQIDNRLTAYGSRWRASFREACNATWVERRQSSLVLDARLSCLDRGRDSVQTLVDELRTRDTDTPWWNAADAVSALPNLDACEDTKALLGAINDRTSQTPPHDAATLNHAFTALTLGHADKAKELYQRLAQRAGAKPATVVARLAFLKAMIERGHAPKTAGHAFRTAILRASEAQMDQLTAEIWLRYLGYNGLDRESYEDIDTLSHSARASVLRTHDNGLRARFVAVQADIASRRGQESQALRFYEQAIELFESSDHEPRDYAPFANTLSGYASLLQGPQFNQRDIHKAHTLLRRALALLEKHYGSQHPTLIDPLGNLASSAIQLRRYDQAIQFSNRAIELALTLQQPPVRTALLRANAAAAYTHLGRSEQALKLLTQAAETFRRDINANSPRLATVMHLIAEANARLARIDEADKNYQEAIEIAQRAHGTNSSLALAFERNYADLLRQSHKTERAIAVYHRVLARTKDKDGDDALSTAFTQVGLALCFYNTKRFARARPLLESAHRIYTSKTGYHPSELARIKFLLAKVIPFGKRARRLADQAHTIYERAGNKRGIDRIESWLKAHN